MLYVAYYRVSIVRQGASGLGLDAQREAVARYLLGRGVLVAAFTEVESGRKDTNRPKLHAALEECRRRRAVLLIARLARLARNVAFIASLMESGVDFLAVDMPEADPLTIHILAAVAEHEREMISKRTKAALAAAKARGTQLGNPRPLDALARANAVNPKHLRLTPEVRNLLTSLADKGKGLRAIARKLNRLNVRTPRGCQWYAETVKDQLASAAL